MSHELQREHNISLVTKAALECFLEKGIEGTKVTEIARRAGLTERSVFRYFSNKTAIVQAASFLFWNRIIEYINSQLPEDDGKRTGLEDLSLLLRCYARLLTDAPEAVKFSLDAELTLDRAGKGHEIKNRPPEPYETSTGPVAKAIKKGIADGSISDRVDARELYYNSYDTILGIMQRLSIGGTPSADVLDYRSRMEHICDMFVDAFRGSHEQ